LRDILIVSSFDCKLINCLIVLLSNRLLVRLLVCMIGKILLSFECLIV